ncbi:response regulator [Balneola vulgaris]|uniref:response regulator n=1 Tax=Balneola vulgaris TaxID=287535 RepID=UPI00058EB93A|nr:response regulator [Balneola vulgaris]
MSKEKKQPLVFVVEDNHAYRILIGRILEQRGFTVMLFENGIKALEMLSFVQPNIILSDIQMPGMDGFELFEEIKLKFPEAKIPFLYISSTQSESMISKANDMGSDALIRKPAQPEELFSVINTTLKNFVAA